MYTNRSIYSDNTKARVPGPACERVRKGFKREVMPQLEFVTLAREKNMSGRGNKV